ncbi:Superoxide dismutase [Striga hermonthica]|uniref:Superoxide dismutase n=1 Tax=Striga hermonthica TaxID=68872 RepID=A0A9N7N801_STRHE|nr:Superoxide dismutase [Striga hermonthica]
MYLRTLFLRRLSTKPPSNPHATQRLSLPPLEYGYLDYEPAIRNDIMLLHHTEHHQAYVTNYNKALDQLDSATASGDASAVVKLQEALKLNAGGHINHSLFWKCIAPCRERGGEPPRDGLCWAIKKNFGCLESLKQKMTTEAAALPGSGWVWLGVDCQNIKRLIVETTANDDPLVTKVPTLVPLLGIDVCEHAYYLQYENAREDYLKNIWKVISWRYANEVYKMEYLSLYHGDNIFGDK